MTLIRNTGDFIKWYLAVLVTYLKARPITTISLVLCAVGSRITRMLSRLLPLKVILLAGSEGVPSYFQPFLAPDQKVVGLIILTAAAILCYGADFFLDGITMRLSESGSRHVAKSANEIVLSDQLRQAQSGYSRVMELTANLVFACVGLGVIATADLWLVAFLLSFFVAIFLFTAWALRGNVYAQHRPLAHFIISDLKNYLGTLSIVSFIVSFLFIVAPFITGNSANVLVAMIAITFLRRTLGSVTSAAKMATSLISRVHEVNALIFRNHQVQRPERTDQRTMRETFAGERRLKVLADELRRRDPRIRQITSNWSDKIGGVQAFSVRAEVDDTTDRAFTVRIFPEQQLKKLDNEEFLLTNASAEALLTPKSLGRVEQLPFQMHVWEVGPSARELTREEWRHAFPQLIQAIWSYAPPSELVLAYRMSHSLLHERLSDSVVQRVSLAVDNQAAADLFDTFCGNLEGYRERIARVPLYLQNTSLNMASVLKDEDKVVVLDWTAWRLDPLGVGHMPFRAEQLPDILAEVSDARGDCPEGVNVQDVALVRQFWILERLMTSGQYRSALRQIEAIVSGIVFEAASDDTAEDELAEGAARSDTEDELV